MIVQNGRMWDATLDKAHLYLASELHVDRQEGETGGSHADFIFITAEACNPAIWILLNRSGIKISYKIGGSSARIVNQEKE